MLYSRFFKGGNFHEFHRSIVIHENFTLKIFTLGFNTITVFKYFNVDKHLKEDSSLGSRHAALPISSESLTRTILSSQINAINDDTKPVLETIMAKGTAM